MIKKVFHSHNGFTLLEILITIALLAAGIIPIITVLSTGISAERSIESRAVALALAMEKMEGVRDTAYAGIAAVASTAVASFTDYSYKIDVASPAANLKQVTVTVTWVFKGANQALSLSTYVANVT
ncbi:MAG: prepilin-type N-terminal cleavage/methylation domain-containing protein [Candidatus Omnitrophica bacterium]|nr:prepilin-type N-terminal cleavage/methylation domain-containing protein [Candidatus Omnitrophota bacterium]